MSRGVNRTRTIEEAGRILPAHVSKAALRAQQQDRLERAANLRDQRAQVAEVMEATEGLPREADGTILGPDGTPILRPVIRDFSSLTSEGKDDPVRAYAEDILKRAARMQRDGATLAQIADALDIRSIVPLPMLERALIRVGHPLLAADIAEGVEPEETKVIVGYEAVGEDDDEPEDDTPTPMGVRPITKGGRS